MNSGENGFSKALSFFSISLALVALLVLTTHMQSSVQGSDTAAAVLLAQSAAPTYSTPALTYRGQNGKQFTYSCPAGTAGSGSIWGTDVYTDDSSVCSAGVHAGAITQAAGGSVTIEIRPGQSSYVSSTRNGVKSYSFGAWQGSFAIVTPTTPTTDASQTCPAGTKGTYPNCASVAPPTCTISATPTNPAVGGATILAWTTTDATAATVSTPSASAIIISNIALSGGSMSVSPIGPSGWTVPYTMTVTNGGGTATCAVSVVLGASASVQTCPAQGNCPAGQTRSTTVDSRGCTLIQCTASAQTCPTGTTGTYPNCTTVVSSLAPTISLTSPDPSATYTVGESIPISWSVKNATANIEVQYELNLVTPDAYGLANGGTAGGLGQSNQLPLGSSAGSRSWATGASVGGLTLSGTYQVKVSLRTCNINGCDQLLNGATLATAQPVTITIKQPSCPAGQTGTYPNCTTPLPASRTVTCAPNFTLGNVWGTSIYTDDSDVCSAAVHAGLLNRAVGGVVIAESRAGQSSYIASTNNGVTSGSYGSWTGSFILKPGTQNCPVLSVAPCPAGKHYETGSPATIPMPNFPGCTMSNQICVADVLITPSSANALTVIPSSGVAPLSVTFISLNGFPLSAGGNYISLSFGDGSSPENIVCASTTGVCTTPVTISHRYVNPGTYTATITENKAVVGFVPVVRGTVTITVGAATTTTGVQTCPSGTTGTYPSCTPISTTSTCPAGTSGVYPVCAIVETGTGRYSSSSRVQIIVPVANVRALPSTAGTINGVQSLGVIGTVENTPMNADGYTWYFVNFDSGVDGWTVESNIQQLASQPAACPAGLVGTPPNCLAQTTPAQTTTQTCPVGTTGTYPNCVSVNQTTSPTNRTQVIVGTANIRATPATPTSFNNIIGTQSLGNPGTIVGGPMTADGYTWYQVNFDAGSDGWTVASNIQTSNIVSTQVCPTGYVGAYPNCVATTANTPALLFAVGDRVQVKAGLSADLRSSPSLTNYYSRGGASAGMQGTVMAGPAIGSSVVWYFVEFNSYTFGWTQQDSLERSTPNTPAPATVHTASPPATPNSTNPITSNVSQTTGASISTGPVGSYYRFSCDSNSLLLSHQPYWPVYGGSGGIYSTDSDICASAVQAGIMRVNTFGDFMVKLVPWQSVTGTSANGITSQSTTVSGPAYEFASLRIGEASPARITNVTTTSGVSPVSSTFTISNIPIGQMNAYALSAFGPDGRSDSNWSIGSYVLDQVNQAFVTTGTKTLTFRTPGTYTIKLMQTVVPSGAATQQVLDTKTVVVTKPDPEITVDTVPGYPMSRNFTLKWLEAYTAYTFADGVNAPVALPMVQEGGGVSTGRTYGTPGTYTIRLLKSGVDVVTKTITIQ